MNYHEIKKIDVANGIGVRVSLFVSGCERHCKGCFNPETWNFKSGIPYTQETTDVLLNALDKDYIRGLTILGGEPLHPNNIETVHQIIKIVRERLPDKTIWVYTGYRYEELKNHDILKLIDVLVDGAFVEELKDISLQFRGSSNQRILKLNKGIVSEK